VVLLFLSLIRSNGEIKINKFYYIIASALMGFYWPTSIEGKVSVVLSLGSAVVPALFLLLSIKLNKWQWARMPYLWLLFLIILIFTLISPFNYVAWGGAAPYILASLVLLTDFRCVREIEYFRVDKILVGVIFSVNIFILAIGFGIVVGDLSAIELIQKYYQSIGEELFEQMVVWYSKPVTIFGSHSTAAFAYFSLFALNLKMALSVKLNRVWRLFFLISAIGFLSLNLFLLSNTSVMMTVGMGVVFVLNVNKIMPAGVRVMFIALLAFVATMFIVDMNIVQLFVGDSKDNGFLARYNFGGRLQGTYNYLFQNYFIPIGISYTSEISLGDNFIAEYIVKTSIIGYSIILYLLWTWLRRHLDFHSTIMFFGFFLLADFAYPLLVYSRFAAALPFYVLLWCRLESNYFLKKSLSKENKFIYGSSLIIKL